MRQFFLSVLALFITANLNAQTATLNKLWEAKEQLPVPESVVYEAGKKQLYVSLIDGEGNVKDGKGGIALLNLDGSIKNANWITGLNAPKGMAIYKQRLYVADLTEVISIDLQNGKILERVEVPNAVFLNDVTTDKQGVVFVSDTRTNKIHRIENGKSTVYLDQVTSANGLKLVDDDLYVLAGAELLKFDQYKNRMVIAKGLDKAGDGLEPLPNGDFLVTCWAGIIYYVRKDGTMDKLLDVQGKTNTADIGFDTKTNTLWVPTFNSNSVIAYQLKFHKAKK